MIRKSSLTLSLCAATLLGVCHTTAALAAPIPVGAVLDQYSFLEPGNAGTAYLTWPGEIFRRAQTFTVGIGGQLNGILVEFNPAVVGWGEGVANEMRLLSVNNGIPGTILASSTARTLSPYRSAAGNFVFGTFDFSYLGLNFNVGDVLAFEIVHDGAVQSYGNSYAGGTDVIINPPYYYDWTPITEIDAAFQTFMTAPGQPPTDPGPSTSVPEPSTFSLLAFALLAAFALQRKGGSRSLWRHS